MASSRRKNGVFAAVAFNRGVRYEDAVVNAIDLSELKRVAALETTEPRKAPKGRRIYVRP